MLVETELCGGKTVFDTECCHGVASDDGENGGVQPRHGDAINCHRSTTVH